MTNPHGAPPLDTSDIVQVPRAFLLDTVSKIRDIAELQVSLAVFRIAQNEGGFDQPVAQEQILRDRALRAALKSDGSVRQSDDRIQTGLDLSVGRNTLAVIATQSRELRRLWYIVNTPDNLLAIAQMTRGERAAPPQLWHEGQPPRVEAERPNAFRLYEQNIGALTPLMADRILEAIQTYPPDWIEDAIGEAVLYNKRNWRYVSRILENWIVDGRNDSSSRAQPHETYRRRDSNALDPDQYKHGRYLDRSRRG